MTLPPKFRPYFTPAELNEVIAALKFAPSPTRLPLIRYLENFAIQIDRGTRAPNLVPIGTKSERFINSLELESPKPALDSAHLFKLWNESPAVLSPKEIAAVMEYRYLNDLMTPEEELEYESANNV